jgi:hypothetical protein
LGGSPPRLLCAAGPGREVLSPGSGGVTQLFLFYGIFIAFSW